MNKYDYQFHLDQTRKRLIWFNFKIQEHMLNLMMKGELGEWDKQSAEGEDILIDNRLFEGSDDENIKELLRLHAEVEQSLERLSK